MLSKENLTQNINKSIFATNESTRREVVFSLVTKLIALFYRINYFSKYLKYLSRDSEDGDENMSKFTKYLFSQKRKEFLFFVTDRSFFWMTCVRLSRQLLMLTF